MIQKPEVTIALVQDALAGFLKVRAGAAAVYANPMLGQTEIPAWYINFMPLSGMTPHIIGKGWMREIGIDLVYLEDMNIPNLYDSYVAKAEILDEYLELFAYNFMPEATEENPEPETMTALIRTYNREWTIDPSALHYKFRLQLMVSPEFDFTKMQVIEELNEKVVEVRM